MQPRCDAAGRHGQGAPQPLNLRGIARGDDSSVWRQFASVSALTLLSRLLGFARDVLMAAYLGAGPLSDAFMVAFRLPNHFRAIFAEGAFNAAFVPAYARIREQGGATRAGLFADRIFTLLLASQIVLLAVALIFTPAVIDVLAPGFRRRSPRRASRAEGRNVEDDVIGGQRQHHGLRVALTRDRGGGGNRRPRIAAHRLDHHGRLHAHVLRLAAGEEMEIRAGNDDRRGEHRVLHPQKRLLIGRALAHQRQELLGVSVARDRPQPRPGAAGQQNGNDRGGHGSFKLVGL